MHSASARELGFADRACGKRLGSVADFAWMSMDERFANALVLHALVADVIPEFAKLGKERVTPFELLTHTSNVRSVSSRFAPDVPTDADVLTACACGSGFGSGPCARVNTTLRETHCFAEVLRRGGELAGARVPAPATIACRTRNHTTRTRGWVLSRPASE